MPETRREKDPLGPLDVPSEALYGVQTLRAKQNFPISGLRPLEPFVRAQVWIKKAAALTHKTTGRLDPTLADAIVQAAGRTRAAKVDDDVDHRDDDPGVEDHRQHAPDDEPGKRAGRQYVEQRRRDDCRKNRGGAEPEGEQRQPNEE